MTTHAEFKERRAALVDDLRNGGHTQVLRALRVKKESQWDARGEDNVRMTPEVVDYYGFSDRSGVFVPSDDIPHIARIEEAMRCCAPSEVNLWRLNDVALLTFPEIADVIEAEPEGLFTS
jgi:hypothetical protein